MMMKMKMQVVVVEERQKKGVKKRDALNIRPHVTQIGNRVSCLYVDLADGEVHNICILTKINMLSLSYNNTPSLVPYVFRKHCVRISTWRAVMTVV
jgi:hypothetical protein